MASESQAAETPWYAAYPEPRSTDLKRITREELLRRMKNGEKSGQKFVLVDVRRTDFEGGTIEGAINLPAHSLYVTIPTHYAIFKAAGIKEVIFWCGSSSGRGPRSAGWFADHIKSQGDSEMQSVVLDGGIKGWARGGDEYVARMWEYDATKW
ncbi:Rhodanese-like protein [Lasiodiplodia theobromae]|uniref:Rhodanese-like protein n=1 Tax=Lasiodiplodia theobromae TaxID=45133 RepID=UPI0015C2F497|nr:Rhodanese-like protein [Lasiodiplodia theobromae]KAF4546795.1 Rhodanese-like protein [Lasiodiplodia theobromae]